MRNLGTFTGDIVYVNYGDISDFDELVDDPASEFFFPDLSDKICMMRYGKVSISCTKTNCPMLSFNYPPPSLQIFRGNKVANAETYGCKAAILYSDPADVAAEGTGEDDVYPSTFWLPGTGIQVRWV